MAASERRRPRRRRAAVYVGPVEERHHGDLARFFEESWGQESDDADLAEWRSAQAESNPAEPGTEPPKWVFTRDDRVLGYLGTVPGRFTSHSGTFNAYWLKGFWVDPEYRSGPVGFEVVKCAMHHLGAAAASLVAPEARRVLEAHGLSDRGVLFNRILLLRPWSVLAKVDPDVALAGRPKVFGFGLRSLQATRLAGLVGRLVSPILRLGARTRGAGASDLRVTTGWDALDAECLDGLWDEFRRGVDAASVRDATFVRWRYGDPELYVPVGVWRDSELRGWAMLRRPSPATSDRLKGVSVASLSDVLFPVTDVPVGLRLIEETERAALQLGADAVLCSGSHPTLERVLARRSFLPIPGNLHILARDDEGRTFPPSVESWWLTRGDGESDGAF